MKTTPSLFRRFLCAIGIHVWDGNTDPEYPTPQCKHCGAWYAPRNVTQKNIVAGGDVCAGSIHNAPALGLAPNTELRECPFCNVKVLYRKSAGLGWHPVQYHDCQKANNKPSTTRKIIQISASGVENTATTQCSFIWTALCDDGSVWALGYNDTSWERLPEIPSDGSAQTK